MHSLCVAPWHLIFERLVVDRYDATTAIHKADVLIEALGWIRRFRDKVTVIKLGGSVMENPTAMAAPAAGHRLHGNRRHAARRWCTAAGRPSAGRWMPPGFKPRFIQGRRYTDDATLRHRRAGPGRRNQRRRSPREIEEFGGRAMSLNFRTDQRAVRRAHDAATDRDGQPIDLGHVGR